MSPFSFVVIFIIFVLFVIIYISSLSYPKVHVQKISEVKKQDTSNDNHIKILNEYNCQTFELKNVNKRQAYLATGNFQGSNLSLYCNNQMIFSQTYNGLINLIFTSNNNLINIASKVNKFRSFVIPLKNNNDYKIVVSKCFNLRVKNYSNNYDVEYSEIKSDYPTINSYSEYDIEVHTRKNFNQFKLERIYPRSTNKGNIFRFTDKGKYLVAYLDNRYNMDLKFNEENVQCRVNTMPTNINFKYVKNIDLTINNLDYKVKDKDFNNEYIDFITGPNQIFTKFMKGEEKKPINDDNKINSKIFIYKII
jgi:hypothetical protein